MAPNWPSYSGQQNGGAHVSAEAGRVPVPHSSWPYREWGVVGRGEGRSPLGHKMAAFAFLWLLRVLPKYFNSRVSHLTERWCLWFQGIPSDGSWPECWWHFGSCAWLVRPLRHRPRSLMPSRRYRSTHQLHLIAGSCCRKVSDIA